MTTSRRKNTWDLPFEVASDLLMEVVDYLQGGDRPTKDAIEYATQVLTGMAGQGPRVTFKRGKPTDPRIDEAIFAIQVAVASGAALNFSQACGIASEKTSLSVESIKKAWSARYGKYRPCRMYPPKLVKQPKAPPKKKRIRVVLSSNGEIKKVEEVK